MIKHSTVQFTSDEKELQKVNKTLFDSDWWFKSKFTIENIDNDTNLILLHIYGIKG